MFVYEGGILLFLRHFVILAMLVILAGQFFGCHRGQLMRTKPSKRHFPVSPSALIGSNTRPEYNPQCLTRDLGPFFGDMLDWDSVTTILDESTNFVDFQRALEHGAHAGGHATVGGLLPDFYSSPGVSKSMSSSRLLIQNLGRVPGSYGSQACL